MSGPAPRRTRVAQAARASAVDLDVDVDVDESGDGAGTVAADRGSAMIEFVGLSVVLLVPFLYFFLALFSVQRSAFAVTQAAREAGRAYATSADETQALDRAQVAADLAFTDQGIDATPQLRFAPAGSDCGAPSPGDGAATLEPGAVFVVCVRTVAALPGLGTLSSNLAAVTVNGSFTVVVDAFRADRSTAT